MLSWIFSVFKWCVFALAVLVLGQLVRWRERPISDHVKSTLAHFDSAPALMQKVEKFSKDERARLDGILSKQAPIQIRR